MATILDMSGEPTRPTYPAEFLSWLQTEEERAKNETLNEQRRIAISFYNGEPFGDEVEGQSQIVTRDVAEVIDYMVPSVLRTMVSGDRVVEFEALDAGFKDVLDDATEAVSQQFMQDQSGWRILHDSLKAGLMEKTGAIKSYVEEKRTRREQEVTATELAQLLGSGVELSESEPIGEFAALGEGAAALLETAAPEELDALGPIMRVAWFDVQPDFVDAPLPNEEFGVAPDARSLEEAAYYNHRTKKTISEIREMGLDADLIGYQAGSYSDTELSRARDVDHAAGQIVRDGANRVVDLLEEYCRYDLNGDGLAEFLRVQRVGTAILSVEEIEYGPCEEWCPFPMPHRRVGQSLADKVMDIQRTRSVLMRQAMNNLYATNNPRLLVNEQSLGDSTIDDILNPDFGAIVRYRGGDRPTPLTIPFVAGNAFQAMEILTGERESRTGITRLNQGLDADALNKTATGTALMQAQGQQIEEYIARNFAEFIGRVFAKKYRLMKDYGKPFRIIVDGEAQTVDPSQWPDEMRVMVRVGLGSGRKEQRIGNRIMLLNLQKEAAQSGDPNVGPEQIFNSVKGIVADLQLGQPNDYYAFDKDAPQPEQGEPQDPAVLEAQAKAQIEQGRLQFDQQKAQAEFSLKERQQQIDADLKARQVEYDLQAKREKDQLDAMLAQQRSDREWELAQIKAQREWELALARLERETALASMKATGSGLPDNRPGGDLAV